MSKKRQGSATQKPWRNLKRCPFCTSRTEPDWKNVDQLSRYISKSGRIQPWDKSKACARHQRALARAVKNARHMALLPFERTRYRN